MFLLRVFTLIILVISINYNCIAQSRWSLRECIDYALKNNINIEKQEIERAKQKNNYKQSKNNLLPDLSFNGTHYYNIGRSLDQTTYTYVNKDIHTDNFSVNSSVTLFDGLERFHVIERNRLSLKAMVARNKELKNEIALQIASRYLDILFQKEKVQIVDTQLTLTKQEVNRTREMVKAGSVSKDVLLEIKAQRASEKYNLVKAQNSLRMYKLELINLMNIDSVENFSIVKPSAKDVKVTAISRAPKEIYQEALNLPRVEVKRVKKNISRQELKEVKSRKYPTLRLNIALGSKYSTKSKQVVNQTPTETTIGYVNNDQNLPVISQTFNNTYGKVPFWDQLDENLNTSFSLELNVPLFNKFRYKNNIENAKLELMKDNKDLELAKQDLNEDIRNAYNDAVSAYSEYNSAQQKSISYQKQFSIAKEKFNIGLYNTIEYKKAKNDLTQAQIDVIRAKYRYLFKRQILRFYEGKPIRIIRE
jgi:outer membrane protein